MRPSLILTRGCRSASAGLGLARRGGRGCFTGGAVSPIGGVWHGNTASRRSISPRRWRCWPSWSHSGLPGSCSNSATVSTAQNARPRTRSRSSGVATGSNTDTDRLQEQANTAASRRLSHDRLAASAMGKRARPLLARPSQRAAAAADRTQAVYHLPLPKVRRFQQATAAREGLEQALRRFEHNLLSAVHSPPPRTPVGVRPWNIRAAIREAIRP